MLNVGLSVDLVHGSPALSHICFTLSGRPSHICFAGERSEERQELARLVQEVCKKAGDLFACVYYGPRSGEHSTDPRVILTRRTISREDTLQAM